MAQMSSNKMRTNDHGKLWEHICLYIFVKWTNLLSKIATNHALYEKILRIKSGFELMKEQ